jgi:YD repeat-containing protein
MPTLRLNYRFVFVLLLSLISFSIARAQITNVTNDQSTPVTGTGHDYIHMLDETVNPANGSVSLRLKTPMPEGRRLSIPFGFSYDSSGFWHLTSDGANDGGSIWISDATILSQGGWSYSTPLVSYFGFSVPWFNGGGTCSITSSFLFQDWAGGRHGLGISTSSDGQGGDGSVACGVSPVTSAGDDFLKATTTGATNTVNPTVWVANLDGAVSYFSMAKVHQWAYAAGVALPDYIEDRNGNKILVQDYMTQQGANRGAFAYTDTLGRTVLSSSGFGVSGTTVSVSGLTGNFTITWGTAASSYSISSLYLNPPGNCAAPPQVSGSQPVVTAIALPNGKSYNFYYDSTYGLLNKVVYPGGGYVRYAWGINSLSDTAEYAAGCAPGQTCNPPGFCNYRYDTPVVTHRYVSFDGTNEALRQDFSYSTNWPSPSSAYWSTKQTIVTTYDLLSGSNFQTNYTYSPSGCGAPDPPNVTANIAFQCPVEQTVVYQDFDGSTLQTVSKTWQDVNMLLSEQIGWGNRQTSKTSYSYLNNNTIPLQIEKDEYDYGQGNPGPLLRKTTTSYQSFPVTPIYPFGPSIYDRPCQTITYDGAGNRVAETDSLYDGGTAACGTVGTPSVLSANGPFGLDSRYAYNASPQPPRGNATTVIQQCFNATCAGGNPTTKYTYDETGQVRTSVDPCGNATCTEMTGSGHTTTYSYADNFDSPPSSNTNAYLTQIADPLGHISKFKYAYSDGQLIQSQDQNDLNAQRNGTTYSYNDSLRRLTETDYPDSGKTTISYNDTPPSPTVTTTKFVTSSSSCGTPNVCITSVAIMDGLGHTTQTQLPTDPDGTADTATTYVGVGRPLRAYNPTRCNPPTTNCGETAWGYTTTQYDALGRIKSVTEQDGSVVSASYSGNCATTTDEAGRARRSCSDAIDRITQVFEDPNGLNYETDYTYDALDNLLNVSQKGGSTNSALWRARTFAYDSLSRLTQSVNPESGTTTYSYDANGNLVQKTSPAPNQTGTATATISYCYDALNRLTSKAYTAQTCPMPSPIASYFYDQASYNGLTITNGIWYRTGMADQAGSEAWSYDSMGRPLTDQRTTSGVTKAIPYTYNLDGSLASITYRQDHNPEPINYTPGGAGRPISAGNSSFGLAYYVHYAPNGSLCSMYSA